MSEVRRSGEFARIKAMVRRPSDGGPDLLELTRLLTDALRAPGGTMNLLPIQAFALRDLYEQGGLFGPLGVGAGKTLTSLMAPVVMEAYRPLLFVPAALREKAKLKDIPLLSQHWRMHRNLRIESYNFLQSPKSSSFLHEYRPDMIILDEAHHLKRGQATRTGRFLDYMAANPETKLVALSGTMSDKSLFDFWRMLKLALPGFKCPLPLHYSIVREWDQALGTSASWGGPSEPLDAGVLKELCAPGETVVQGFRRRLIETPGVVASTEAAFHGGLLIKAVRPEVPAVIDKHLTELRREQKTAWGEVIEDGLALARHAQQLACFGGYYQWEWPNGPDEEWLQARADWHREVREWIRRKLPNIDSPFLVGAAIARGELESEFYAPWIKVRDRYRPHPPVKTTILSPFVFDYAVGWLKEHPTGIVWYGHSAVGRELAKRGVKVYGAGKTASREILTAKGPIAASIQGHGTGKDLVQWDHNLLLSCPGALLMQQLIARTHRRGQQSEEVVVEICQHTEELQESWRQVLIGAEKALMGEPQKVLQATRVGFCV